MDFYEWTIKTYLGKNNSRGDLAGDMAGDATFPRTHDRARIRDYLEWERNACDSCLQTFERTWKSYLTWYLREVWCFEKTKNPVNKKQLPNEGAR
ncbi:sterile alpha motif-like domain-containing protein [Eubacteriales bacterium OttesenSCG-928-G02]|nr:sterile alpha motif-like domain-containing protein [Eubacteriales bacterium OttesenSCG-928-G02]